MSARTRALELIAQKQTLEQQLSSQFSILEANASNMNSPLIDPEGFPRADIDVWAVRHARVRIIELNNDLSRLMDQIATALQSGALSPAEHDASSPPSDDKKLTNGVRADLESITTNDSGAGTQPFALVNGVAPRSPADDAVRIGW